MVTETKKKCKKSPEELERLRQLARKNRYKFRNDIEMYSSNPISFEDKNSLDRILRLYFVNLNVLIYWRSLKKQEVTLGYALKNLEYRLHHKLGVKYKEIELFLVEYIKESRELNLKYPYPKAVEFIYSGYTDRHDKILDLRKDAVKTLKNILEGNKE